MSATGADTNASTTSSFVAALVVAGITVGVFTAIWLIMRNRAGLRKVFQPRVELAPESKRPEPLPKGLVPFWKAVFKTPDASIIAANGPDAYFFVRFIKVFGLYMLVPYFFLSFVICIPISAASPTAGLTGLNILTFGNVSPSEQVRHVGHFLVAIILMSWTLFLIWHEYNHYIEIRQAWLTSAQHLTLARARTMLITGLPDQYNSEASLKELAGTVAGLVGHGNGNGAGAPRMSTATEGTAVNPTNGGAASPPLEDTAGGIRQVWLTKNVKELEKIWEERDNEVLRLEGGVSKLQKLALKNDRKGKTPEKKGTFDAETATADPIPRYVLDKKRPTWKQGLLGLIGKKMNLDTSPVYIAEHNVKLDEMRKQEYKQGNTAFIRFGSQAEAHNFARLAPSVDKKLRLAADTSIELVPEDVQWSNTSMNPYQRKIRTIISWSLTIGLIIIWAIPVAFVGAVSNVDGLCANASWLAWVCKLPAAVVGIIKGVLPPVLLAVLFMLLPIVLRLWIKLQGEVRKSEIELKLFTRFWLFQVIHGFIIVTLSSGLISALGNLGQTASSVPTLLASNLPGASIFFLTYILTSTFASAAKSYSRAIPTVMYALHGILGGNTPRKWYLSSFKMQSFAWATTWPPMCLIICVTIVYSVIQPIITLLTLVAMILMYAAYKYTMYWCADQPDLLETGGLFYIKALRTVFVSLYLEGVCLAGLFFLSTNESGGRTPTGLACGALMIVMIVITAVFQTYIDWYHFRYNTLVYATPRKSNFTAEIKRAPTSQQEEESAAGPEHGNTSGFHSNAFEHPALWKKQPCVWIADEPLGLGKYEVAQITKAGVESSTEFAKMDEKGKLTVERSPPDEAWYGGFSS